MTQTAFGQSSQPDPHQAPSAESPAAQVLIESYKIYDEHPRLFLRPQRLKLLRRERDRQTLRWEQFDRLMRGGAPMPEPGFAGALYFQITGDKAAGRRAVEWALKKQSTDVRQLALVFDWCQELLTLSERQQLAARLEKTVTDFQAPAPSSVAPANSKIPSISSLRDVVLAAVAVGDLFPAPAENALRRFAESDWQKRLIPALRAGNNVIDRKDSYPLLEIFHAIRDNLNADLRDSFAAYFRDLPVFHLMSYYPASYPAAENEYHIPAQKSAPGQDLSQPDLTVAMMSRAAELAMVAYDTNSPGTQVLQGWLMNDRFLMRGTQAICYEFLWANPYQPGLSYYHVPLVYHDEHLGRVFVRSNWDDTAAWAGFFEGQLQLFQEGQVAVLNPELSREPLDLDEAMIFSGRDVRKFHIPDREFADIFIVGLPARSEFDVEVDDEEMYTVTSDTGGILYFPKVRGGVGVRLSPVPAAVHAQAITRK